MFEDVSVSHPVRVGLVGWPSPRVTVIVKVTTRLDRGGVLSMLAGADQEPLRLDTFDDAGRLVYATDFAPHKPACDVLLVDAEAPLRPTVARLSIGDHEISRVEGLLGPRESVLEHGDPLSAPQLWTDVGSDFARFQVAEPRLRIPYPRPELRVLVETDRHRFLGYFPGPMPRATVVSPDGGRAFARSALVLDTLQLVLDRGLLVVTYRAVLDVSSHGRSLVIELCDAHGVPWPEPRWSGVAPAMPQTSPRTRPSERGRPPSSTGRSAAAPMVRTAARTALVGPLIPSEPLPFARTATSSSPPARPADGEGFASLRRAAQVAPAWSADRTAVGPRAPTTARTVASPPASAAPPPLHPAPHSPLPPVLVLGAHLGAPKPPEAPPPTPALASASWPPARPPELHAPVPRAAPSGGRAPAVDGLPDQGQNALGRAIEERVARIQREIWAGERTLHAILSDHGVGELEWRLMKQRARRTS